MLKKVRQIIKKLFSQKEGSEILQFIIIIAIVAVIAVAALPSLGQKINEKAQTSVQKIEEINEEDFK